MPLAEPEHFSIQGRCCDLFKDECAEAALSCLLSFSKELILWLHGGKAEPKERPLGLCCLQGGEGRERTLRKSRMGLGQVEGALPGPSSGL